MLSVKVLLFNPRRTVLVNVSMRRWFNPFELRLTAWQGGKTSTREEKRLPTADAGLTAWCQETSQSLGLPELARRVRVSWNARMQTTAGRAWWPDRWIELNP